MQLTFQLIMNAWKNTLTVHYGAGHFFLFQLTLSVEGGFVYLNYRLLRKKNWNQLYQNWEIHFETFVDSLFFFFFFFPLSSFSFLPFSPLSWEVEVKGTLRAGKLAILFFFPHVSWFSLLTPQLTKTVSPTSFNLQEATQMQFNCTDSQKNRGAKTHIVPGHKNVVRGLGVLGVEGCFFGDFYRGVRGVGIRKCVSFTRDISRPTGKNMTRRAKILE